MRDRDPVTDNLTLDPPTDETEPTEPAEPSEVAEEDAPPHWVAKDDVCRLIDVMGVSGASYRQLDYWWRSGYLHRGGEIPKAPGSGASRLWTGREQRIADLMIRLSRVGISGALAARMARDSVDGNVHRVTTEDRITISWEPVR